MRRRNHISIQILRSRCLATAGVGSLIFVLFAASPAATQKVEIRNKSQLSFDSVRLTDIISVTDIDVSAAVQHSRCGLRWSLNTGDKVASLIRGVLSFETGTLADGNGAAHQLVYGRNVRHGYGEFNDFDRLRRFRDESVFGDDGINIESPLYMDDDPLAWLIEGYGARLGSVALGRKNELEVEVVKYVNEVFWFGGELAMEDGVTRTVEAKFGATAQDLKLASTVGYDPQNGSFLTSVAFRWIPKK